VNAATPAPARVRGGRRRLSGASPSRTQGAEGPFPRSRPGSGRQCGAAGVSTPRDGLPAGRPPGEAPEQLHGPASSGYRWPRMAERPHQSGADVDASPGFNPSREHGFARASGDHPAINRAVLHPCQRTAGASTTPPAVGRGRKSGEVHSAARATARRTIGANVVNHGRAAPEARVPTSVWPRPALQVRPHKPRSPPPGVGSGLLRGPRKDLAVERFRRARSASGRPRHRRLPTRAPGGLPRVRVGVRVLPWKQSGTGVRQRAPASPRGASRGSRDARSEAGGQYDDEVHEQVQHGSHLLPPV
jgi:hypothetical protein